MVIGISLFFQTNYWVLEMFDIEAAFLNADLEGHMYVEWPEGMVELGFLSGEDLRDYCIRLDRAMYGNVAAPLRFFKTLTKHLMTEMDMLQSAADPCIFYKQKNGSLTLLLAIFVDDTIITGKREDVDWFYNEIEKRFNIERLGQLKRHLGIWWEWKKDKHN